MEFTSEQIAGFKAKHGDIYLFEVDGKSCILHEPTRQDYSYLIACKDEMKMNELIIAQLWVDGDQAIKDEFKLTLAVAKKASTTLFEMKEAEIKKL